MIIQHIGHAEFLLETAGGMRIVTDPYDESTGYPVRRLKADAALVSHGHHDHNALETLVGLQMTVDKDGEFTTTLFKGEYFQIKSKVLFHSQIEDPIFTFTIKTLQSRSKYEHAMESAVPHCPAPVSVVTPLSPCFFA